MGASLELMLINAETGDIAWGGTSEWKRGGILVQGKRHPMRQLKTWLILLTKVFDN
jgi:hypothetical protein